MFLRADEIQPFCGKLHWFGSRRRSKFVSTKVEDLGDKKLRLHGNLTIRSVTKPITLEGEFTGAVDFMGTQRAGFTATGKINRKDFGVSWNKVLDTGGLVVSDEVVIVLKIEGSSKPESE